MRRLSTEATMLLIEGVDGYGMYSHPDFVFSQHKVDFREFGIHVDGKLIWTHRDSVLDVSLDLGVTTIDKVRYIRGKNKSFYDIDYVLLSGKFGYRILDDKNIVLGLMGSCDLTPLEDNRITVLDNRTMSVIGGNTKSLLIYCFFDKRLYLVDYTYRDGAVSFSVDGVNQIVVPRVDTVGS